ncbi:hypothetical protein ACT1U9_31835 [Streptomyces sp. BR1]|uniref:hypothetical protein n=1 Tax=Streptomyces sp. BR1 TaxID=1592323 RepID=UPI00402BAF20
MRRCATVAAIALCGAVVAGTTGPAFAAAAPEPRPADGHSLSRDRRDGDDDKTELATWMAELDKLIADEKKDLDAEIKDAKKDSEEAKDDAKKEIADSKKEFDAFLKEFADLIKNLTPDAAVPPKP